MNRISAALAAVILSAAGPVFAQSSLPVAAPANAAVRTCMQQQLSGLKQQVHAHMAAYRAANPAATGDARKAERKAFGKQLRQANRPMIQAARAACGAHR